MILADAMRAKMGRTPLTTVSPRAAPAREQDSASPHLALLIVDVLEAKAELDHLGRSYRLLTEVPLAGATIVLARPYGKMIELNQVDQCCYCATNPCPR